jgi:alkylation response protein AidB-like acyl-CoA dehydrogenase
MQLNSDQLRLQALAKEFTATHIIPFAMEFDRKAEFPQFVLEETKKAGLICMAIPKSFGGDEYDSVTQSLVVEEWAYGCAAFATTLGGNGLSSYPLLIAGTEEQKRLYFTPIVEGGLGAFALTEPGAGSDAGACKTIARRVGDEYILNGVKCFCTNGSYAKVFVIFASTDPDKGVKGLSAFIVERECAGLSVGSVEHKLGIRSSNTIELLLKDVHIPADRLLGKEGDGMKIAMKTLDMARPIVASIGVGVARRALDECLKQLSGGKPGQAVQFALADMEIQIEAARALVRHALSLKDAGLSYSKESAVAKTFATDTAMHVCAAAQQLLGSLALSSESVLQKLLRDAKVLQIYEGTNQIQRMVIAGQVLREDAEKHAAAAAGGR